jgi:hypothetical protein
MISQEQLFIEAIAFSCYQFQLEMKKAVDNLIREDVLSNHNNQPISKEDDL